MQPDTIIPNLYNPQSLNRFSYVLNNPIVYIDPSGHNEVPWLVALIASAVVFAYDVGRRHGSDNYCDGALSECFQSVELKKFTENQVIDPQEFHDMLNAINTDLHKKLRTAYDPARADYDTPFFNGANIFNSNKVEDNVVCIDNKCSPQSAVNYVAQGMYSAHTGQSLEDAKELADRWNRWVWHHDKATDDERYWLEYGYSYYSSLNKKNGTNRSKYLDKKIVME